MDFRHEGMNFVLAVLVIPELGGNPEIFAPKARREQALQHLTDMVFVAVDRCTVKVAVSNRDCALDRLRDTFRWHVIRAESAQPYSRDHRARVKRPFGDEVGINTIRCGRKWAFQEGFIRFLRCSKR